MRQPFRRFATKDVASCSMEGFSTARAYASWLALLKLTCERGRDWENHITSNLAILAHSFVCCRRARAAIPLILPPPLALRDPTWHADDDDDAISRFLPHSYADDDAFLPVAEEN